MRITRAVLPVPVLAVVVVVGICVCASTAVLAQEDVNRLQELIDKAAPGGEVVVPKGTYDQPVNITKPIKLRGEDRDACVVDVASDEPAVRLQHKGQSSTIENLTVRWKRATTIVPPNPQAAVVAKDAGLRLNNVRITAPDDGRARCPAGLLAVGVCDVKVESCAFEGFEFTIQFADGAKGSIADCTVSKPVHCGITVGANSSATVSRTIVTGSGYHGVRATGGEINLADSLVVANKNRGVYLGNKSARGTIENCAIVENATGISAFAQSEVKITNNFIGGSDYAAVDMRDSCRLRVEQNLLANNTRGVVLVKEAGGGKNGNTVGKNASASNKTESEGFPADAAPEMQKVDGPVADGDFTTDKAKGFGPTDPAKLKPVWERWTKMKDGGAKAE